MSIQPLKLNSTGERFEHDLGNKIPNNEELMINKINEVIQVVNEIEKYVKNIKNKNEINNSVNLTLKYLKKGGL
ncbi:hypothetical protein [Bacillus licheniformis]|uniref:hypothetical protein n=1 Tax=Bacillus licheniformis TaxID=1402 RepID=UPI000925AE75|nr:hypothetical protein [Bacillus licheniformis]OJT57359.1 hypothetical protein BFP47_11665 [Bacillus licheniformis]OJT69999.1 hypothetical protein BFP46_05225 [Bacillus licheniformis]